jgi:hypothetical protein
MTMDNDPFSDVRKYKQSLGGIFEASDGLGELNQARTSFQQTGQGIRLDSTCQNCGLPNGVDVDWGELTAIMMKLAPQGWIKDDRNGVMMPHVGCAKCGVAVSCGLTPDDCKRALHGGIEGGHITEQQVAQAQAHIANRTGHR